MAHGLAQHEWLETDGYGGYASLSAAMGPLRRYHGLLAVNLPNVGPHVLLQRLDPTLVLADGREIGLAEVTYADGTRHPAGADHLVEFGANPWPQTTWSAAGFVLRMGVMMPRPRVPWRPSAAGEAAPEVLVRFEVLAAPAGAKALLRLRPMVVARSVHATTRANLDLNTRGDAVENGLVYQPYAGLPALHLTLDRPLPFNHAPDWHLQIAHPLDQQRGYRDAEDAFTPGFFEGELDGGVTVRIAASASAESPAAAWERAAGAARARPRPLGLDPSAFLADLPGQGPSLIAGYPWFGAWGRDTAISVPGLCFSQGLLDEGLDLLAGLLGRAPRGIVANLFGADGAGADNAVDATLLSIWACDQYLRFGGDAHTLARRVGPDLVRILALWLRGEATHVSVGEHGLPRAGDFGTNYTWMDAKVHGVPVTPRPGTPVEVAALWLRALGLAERLHAATGLALPPGLREAQAAGRAAFHDLFFLPALGFFADTVEADGRRDARLRPNQLWAITIGLEEGFIPPESARRALAAIETHLLTPVGLRTLAPHEPGYSPRYAGGPEDRDRVYHQGTVWPWLAGPYVEAVLAVARASGRKVRSQALLDYFRPLLDAGSAQRQGAGGIPEVFDAEAPQRPEGCPWQAWSVAETLRLHRLLSGTDAA